MTDLTKLIDLSLYRRFEKMNLEELKQNAEALNTPATAFDILTLHKSISVLEEKLNKISEELSKITEITINNGINKKAKLVDLVVECYQDHKNLRLKKIITDVITKRKRLLLIIILFIVFIFGTITGVKLNLDIIKFLFTL